MDFKEEYLKLNEEQKKAVDNIDGPVMVVAGPGTGKTQILTLRIANILNKVDIEPENILALTFTESGAASMKKRLISIIGNNAYRVNISTFHGFCNDIIQKYPEYFANIAGFKNIDEIKQIQILRKVLDNIELKDLATFNNQYFYIKEIKHLIEELKKESISFAKLREVATKTKESFQNNSENFNPKTGKVKSALISYQRMINKNIELSYVFEQYQEELKKLKYYDYSDMIVEVLNTFQENQELLLIVQEQYHYFLVDEYQDTNTSQNKILEILCNFFDNPNIFIVGDPKQAIFRFQGASIKNFEFFKKLYPSAIMIDLVNNYRSSQLILDSAHHLIKKDAPLKSCVGFENKKIKVCALINPQHEAYFVAKEIDALIKSGANKNSIAVLYRNHRDSDLLVEMLDKFKVPYSIKKKINIFNDIDIQKMILVLKAIYNYGNDEYLFKCMHIDFLKIEPIDIYKIISYCAKNKISGYEVLKYIDEINLESKAQVEFLYKKLKDWSILSSNELFLNVFDTIIKDVNFYQHLQKSDNVLDKLDKVDGFFDQIKKIATMEQNFMLANFIEYLNIIKENSIDITKDSILGDLGGVKLMTAHHAKGLEFDNVFVLGANSNKWECKKVNSKLKIISEVYQVDESETEAEERNLFFVCLTRAKKQITITYCDSNQDGKSLIESSFVNEIKEECKEFQMPNIEGHLKDERLNFVEKQSKKYTIKDRDLIREVFSRNGLSVTAFNNYMECPWKYFYRNLFRLPEVQNKALIKGDAIHMSLKDFFNRYKEDGRPEKEFLLERFEYYLSRFPLSIKDFDQIKKEGIEILTSYYEAYPEFHSNVLNEFSISGVNIDEDIRLTGKLDKLEILSSNLVNVIDYKTGKPKSENEIMGMTKSSDENYYNQLKFYGLLLKYHQEGKYKMAKGVIDFVEPNESKKHIKREFVIGDNEIDELELEVRRVGHEILELAFWDKYCDNKDCEFCKLRKMME